MSSDLLINYGDKLVDFKRIIRVNQTLRPKNKPALHDPHKSFINAISEPKGELPLVEKISKASKVAIIIGDRRKVKQQVILIRYILELLKNVDPKNIAFFLASAERVKLTLEDINLPDDLIKKFKFIKHDSTDENAIYVGVTSSNTQVRVNKELLDFDLKIGIDVIRPHLFAGYSGGGQIILPGLSHKSTIIANHAMRIKDKCVLGNALDNPAKNDMNEAASLIDNLFVVNYVLTREDEFYAFVAGAPKQAFEAGAKPAKSVYGVPAKPTDIVIVSGGHDFTTNLYQAGKLLGSAGMVLNPGGVVILVARCENGSGNQEEFFTHIYQKSLIHYLPIDHKIFLVSDISPDKLKDTIYTPFSTLDEAQDAALKVTNKEATLTVMHNAEYIIPEE